jgi:signal transduction histidine kinase
MKSEFIGKVSHELKTPLTSIGMAIGIMEDGVVGIINEKQSDLIQTMKEDYERLNKLIQEILELTRLESDNFSLQIEKIDLNKLVLKIRKNFLLQGENKKISIDVDQAKSPAYVNADYNYLSRAVENIVSNALKFTPEGGSILLKLDREENDIILSIQDTGIGIAPENIDRIFDKFVQLNNNISGSIGLGLSIAKEIIEMHKGEIMVKSLSGKGTDFQIKLAAVQNE